MEPWKSWLGAVTIAGGLVWYYRLDSKKTRSSRQSSTPEQSHRQRQDKPSGRRVLESAKQSSFEESEAQIDNAPAQKVAQPVNGKKRKGGQSAPKAAPAPPRAELVESIATPDNTKSEADYDDREWAKQLEARKKGVTLSNNESNAKGPKLQKKRNQKMNGTLTLPEQPTSSDFDTASSQGSRETPVDDMANSMGTTGDISDMLEKPAPGPSVIRVTGEEKQRQQQRPVANGIPAKESKKQRQRRKKAEEQKQQYEEAEAQRKVLMENQRRTARESRGEPAKNGVAPAKPPTSNAWSSAIPTPAAHPTAAGNGTFNNHVPALLDTFEHDAGSTTSSNDAHTAATTPATAASTIDQDLPDEETQLAMLSEISGDAGWNEVAKSKKGKKKSQASTPQAESGSKEHSAPASPPVKANPMPNGAGKFTAPKKAPAIKYLEEDEPPEPLYTPHIGGHPLDSDWAVE